MGDGSNPTALPEVADVPLIESFLGIGTSRNLPMFEEQLRDRLESLQRSRSSAVIIEAVTLKSYQQITKVTAIPTE
jgi:hypothetical protein